MNSADTVYKSIQRELLRKHFDANETAFLERELNQLRARVFEMQFPELKAKSFMPLANDVAPSANIFSYKVMKPVGRGKFVANGAHDLPRIDVEAEEKFGKVRPVGYSYGFDINELREAARVGVPISDLKAKTTRDQCERDVDEVLAFGDFQDAPTNVSLNGLVNNPDVIAQGVADGTLWGDGDQAAALAEMNGLISSVSTTSLQTFNVNTLLLPTAKYLYLAQTPYSDLSSTSLLKVLMENNPQLKLVAPWYRLDTAGDTGKPRAVAYQMDPLCLEGVVPQPFEQLPPEARGLEIIINCTTRVGGVKIYQPRAFKYLDFATS